MKSDIKQLIAAIRKEVPSTMVKIENDQLFGVVSVRYANTSPKAQKAYQLIKEVFRVAGFPVVYKGSYFTVTYGTTEAALERMFNETKSVAEELIGR
jgi:hypothetical protein